jgi:thiol:disulfide interchange protein DsbD
MFSIKTLFFTIYSLFIAECVFGQAGNFHDSRDQVEVSIQINPERAVVGTDAVVAVIMRHSAHYHTHTNKPKVPEILGDAEDYIATSIVVELPDNSPLTFHEGYTQWPEPNVVQVGFTGTPVDYGVFSDDVVIFIPVTIAADAELGKAQFTVKPIFQACDDKSCLAPTPSEGDWGWDEYGITASIEIVEASDGASLKTSNTFEDFDASVFANIHEGIKAPSDSKIVFDAFGVIKFTLDARGPSGLFLLLLVAMGGGFLLNLTPCVLPVIPIKIMGLSASAGNRRKTLYLGVWMMLGVMSLWILLGVGIALVAGFTAINQLFQYPAFTISLGVFIGIMAVGMGGLFSIQLPNVVYKVNPKHDSWFGSFLFGIMTAVLSTPCTAPFMGAAAAWATTQSAITTLIVFGSIGFGMAFPYLILAAFPHLVEKMPRAGASSEVIKQVMGLLMLAAAAYFLGVGLSGALQQEGAPPSRFYLWIVAACVASAGVWLAWRTLRIAKTSTIKIFFVILGFVIIVAAILGGFRLTDKGPIDWEYYTPEILSEKLNEGDVVVLEFTAEWCLNCKMLESTVLHDSRVVEAFSADDVTPIKIDLTGNNVSGNELLNEVGGLRIPLLIIMGPDGEEDFRGDFYTPDQILEAIKKSRGSK